MRAAIERWKQQTLPAVALAGDEPAVGPLEALEAWHYEPGAGAWVTAAAGAGGLVLRPRPVERYRGALRRLRRWAAAERIDDDALGYPGELAWAVILAAKAAAVPCDPTDEDLGRTLVEACIRTCRGAQARV